MNLPQEFASINSKYYILPIEYEGNLTGKKGASKGSSEIIKSSNQLEYYDEQFNQEPYKKGIYLLPSLTGITPEEITKKISDEVSKHKKFLISLGGDHSVSIGIVKGLEKIHDSFSMIVFDAHPDLFYSWNNSTLNHRCTSFHISSKHPTSLIGIRSMDKDELDVVKNNNVNIIYSHENIKQKLLEILPNLKNKVYISIDVDSFDPSFIRNTGTPEPGGLGWYEVLELLKKVAQKRNIVGFDIVELCPNPYDRAPDFLAAKLAYKLLSYSAKFKK